MGNDDFVRDNVSTPSELEGSSAAAAGKSRFGHHPDPATDFCVEVDDIAAEIVNLDVFDAGPAAWHELDDRIEKALDFRVSGNADAIAAKAKLREMREQFSSALVSRSSSAAAAGKSRDDYTAEDMENVGRSLMDSFRAYRDHSFMRDWHPMNDPAEIVGDLLNEVDELNAELSRSRLQPAAASNVSTPSEHGSSAAAAGKATMDMETDAKLFAAALYTITDMWRDEMDDMQRASLANQIVREIERRGIIQPAAASEADNVSTPSEHGSSAAAAGKSREVEINDLIKNLDWYGKHYFNNVPEARTITFDRCMRLSEMCTKAADALSRLQPAAASEGASPEAVNQSPDVAEMVERLRGKRQAQQFDSAGRMQSFLATPTKLELEAASLLQSLARERERLLYDLGSIANQCKVADDPEHMTLALVRKIAEHAIARSALPHPDTKGT